MADQGVMDSLVSIISQSSAPMSLEQCTDMVEVDPHQ